MSTPTQEALELEQKMEAMDKELKVENFQFWDAQSSKDDMQLLFNKTFPAGAKFNPPLLQDSIEKISIQSTAEESEKLKDEITEIIMSIYETVPSVIALLISQYCESLSLKTFVDTHTDLLHRVARDTLRDNMILSNDTKKNDRMCYVTMIMLLFASTHNLESDPLDGRCHQKFYTFAKFWIHVYGMEGARLANRVLRNDPKLFRSECLHGGCKQLLKEHCDLSESAFDSMNMSLLMGKVYTDALTFYEGKMTPLLLEHVVKLFQMDSCRSCLCVVVLGIVLENAHILKEAVPIGRESDIDVVRKVLPDPVEIIKRIRRYLPQRESFHQLTHKVEKSNDETYSRFNCTECYAESESLTEFEHMSDTCIGDVVEYLRGLQIKSDNVKFNVSPADLICASYQSVRSVQEEATLHIDNNDECYAFFNDVPGRNSIVVRPGGIIKLSVYTEETYRRFYFFSRVDDLTFDPELVNCDELYKASKGDGYVAFDIDFDEAAKAELFKKFDFKNAVVPNIDSYSTGVKALGGDLEKWTEMEKFIENTGDNWSRTGACGCAEYKPKQKRHWLNHLRTAKHFDLATNYCTSCKQAVKGERKRHLESRKCQKNLSK